MKTPSATNPGPLVLERSYSAPIEAVWALWTTKAGIESWWGPDGFQVTVESIDLRPGGSMAYAMAATAPEQIAFMEQAGMPAVTRVSIAYTEVEPPSRLAFSNLVDFVPGVPAYETAVVVELAEVSGGVRMVVTLDRMHDDVWTQRAMLGWESQLARLAALVERGLAPAS